MAGTKVKLKDQLGRVISLNTDATDGATLGKNLYGSDGKLLTADQIINPAPSQGNAVATIWKLIREIPSNIQKVAALVSNGVAVRRVNGEWSLLTLTPGPGVEIENGDGDAGNPVIGLNEASLASLALADSALQSIQPGPGVSVDNTDPQNPIVSASGGAGGGILPVVTGEIVDGQPVFLIADDGSLIYTEIT